jgi:heptosyltransferase-2
MTRVLIVAPAWIGDMVMAQSLVAALQRREPDVTVDLLAPAWTAPLGERLPGIRRMLRIETVHGRLDLKKRWRFGYELKAEGYDLAIVLPSSFKSALVPFAAGIPRRRGYVGEWRYGILNDVRGLDDVRTPRTVDQFVALAGARGEAPPATVAPVVRADPEMARALAQKLGLGRDARPVVALCPGAEFGPSKQWPAAHFAALAEILAGEGYRTWLLGSPKDTATGETIRTLASARDSRAAPVNLAGKTNLIQALDLLSLTEGVVANDSGLMHISGALGRPVVALYGSTTSEINPPLGDGARVLERTLPCRPCFERVCPLGHHDCMNLIRPEKVAAALAELLQRGKVASSASTASATGS